MSKSHFWFSVVFAPHFNIGCRLWWDLPLEAFLIDERPASDINLQPHGSHAQRGAMLTAGLNMSSILGDYPHDTGIVLLQW